MKPGFHFIGSRVEALSKLWVNCIQLVQPHRGVQTRENLCPEDVRHLLQQREKRDLAVGGVVVVDLADQT
jgi:hypothetical protein